MPTTALGALSVPTTGSESGTWGSASLNPNFVALDGYGRGVQSISLSSATTITLSAPAGSITPGTGPTQAQNAVLKFSGTITGTATITLPLPGYYIVRNACLGSFPVIMRAAGTGNVIGVPPSAPWHLFSDGTDVEFVNMGFTGQFIDTPYNNVIPWLAACTVRPILNCDGNTYSTSIYPALGALLGSTFGGNGVSTFGVPDLSNRMRIPWGTSGRVTSAVSGINGAAIGGAGGAQATAILQSNMPNTSLAVTINDSRTWQTGNSLNPSAGGPFGLPGGSSLGIAAPQSVAASTTTLTGTAASGGSAVPLVTMPPTLVVGYTFIKT